MNPESRSGSTVSGILQGGLLGSIAVPLFALAVLAFFAQLNPNQLMFTVFSAVLILIGILLLHLWVQRSVRERIQALNDVYRTFMGGDKTARAAVNGDDDFAQLSLTFNTLLDNQGSNLNNALGAGGSDAAALQAQIEKLLQEVSAVGDGDLRVQAEVTPDTLGVLADSFNYMIEELAKVVGRVQTTAVQVTNATRRILDRSSELAQASETQVSQISQTTEAVEALAIFIQNVARNAQLSAEMAQEALRSANNGQQAVRQSINGMMVIRENVQETSKKIKRLGERSNEIGEIVRIIEDIADQTNLLALNAAIQSAMAGEHGRGFAVVADEIRLLAERSTDSTKRIATLVKSIQGDTYEAVVAMEDSTQEVVKGSQLADDAGRSLNSIYSAVERQAQMIEGIARAANEQTTVSEAVAVAMGRISEITRQTDSGTQEAAVSVSYLAELSEQLRASVSTFRLPERGNEMFGSFSNMTSVTELSDGNGGQSFGNGGQSFSAPPLDGSDWGQGFSGSFPPLPEPGNAGSLVPMSPAPAGQFSFNNSQDLSQMNFGNAPQFGGNPQQYGNAPQFGGNSQHLGSAPQFGGNSQQYGNAPQFGGNSQQFGNAPQYGNAPQFGGNSQDLGQSGFGSQAPFSAPPGFGGQPAFGNPVSNGNHYGFGEQQFGNQPGFSDPGSFDSQQVFNSGNWYNNGQQFGAGAPAAPGYGAPGPNQGQMSPNSGLLQPPPQIGQLGQPSMRMQRWQSGPAQNQPPFNPEQRPVRDNG